jgi:hypothetical protein
MLAAACGDPSGPPSGLPGGSMGVGTSADGTGDAALTGTWQTVLVVQVADDFQTWTTTWRFAAAGTCRQTVVTESLAEGFPRTATRDCTWRTNDGAVAITFAAGGTVSFDFSFAALDPARLVLDGLEYHRVA